MLNSNIKIYEMDGGLSQLSKVNPHKDFLYEVINANSDLVYKLQANEQKYKQVQQSLIEIEIDHCRLTKEFARVLMKRLDRPVLGTEIDNISNISANQTKR